MPPTINPFFVTSYKKRNAPVSGIIIHYISAINTQPEDPYNINEIIRIFNQYKVSADFLIQRDGTIYRLVPKSCYSYHCGVSEYPDGTSMTLKSGKKSLNEITIGIELIGLHGEPFTNKQYESLIWLTHYIKESEHQKLNFNLIFGHEDVATPLGRKKDPGPSFDWKQYRDGIFGTNNSLNVVNSPLKKPVYFEIINKVIVFIRKFLNK